MSRDRVDVTEMSYDRESPTDQVSCDVGYPKIWNSHNSRFLQNTVCSPTWDVLHLQVLIEDAFSIVTEACLLLGSRPAAEKGQQLEGAG